MGSHRESRPGMAATRVEVTRGEFDPREYKKLDKAGWAKKRRADWMATTGKISFVRERVVPSEEREITPTEEVREIPVNQEEKIQNIDIKQLMERSDEPPRELIEKPKMIGEEKPKTEFWPRKKRSDITSQRYI